MILFPNAKINLGLRILRRRPDGYHDIESLMLPVEWSDILEIVPAFGDHTTLVCSGLHVDCPPEKNLVMKAEHAIRRLYPKLPPSDIYLRKIVPDGAGLGGGSSDAAFTLIGLNALYSLGMDHEQLASVATEIGADCPFFIYNKPMLATGTGTTLEPIDIDLAGIFIAIAKPNGQSVSTAEAYAGVTPACDGTTLADAFHTDRSMWRWLIDNDFEPSIEPKLPEIGQLKIRMNDSGAFYTAMSGSGSAVFGLFDSAKMAESAVEGLEDCTCWTGPLAF